MKSIFDATLVCILGAAPQVMIAGIPINSTLLVSGLTAVNGPPLSPVQAPSSVHTTSSVTSSPKVASQSALLITGTSTVWSVSGSSSGSRLVSPHPDIVAVVPSSISWPDWGKQTGPTPNAYNNAVR